MAHAKIHWLEARVEGLVTSENALQKEVHCLQQDKASLQATITHLQSRLLDLGLSLTLEPEDEQQAYGPDQFHNQSQPQKTAPFTTPQPTLPAHPPQRHTK